MQTQSAMPNTLFDDQANRRPDAKQGQKVVYDSAPDGDSPEGDPSEGEASDGDTHEVDAFGDERRDIEVYTAEKIKMPTSAYRGVCKALSGTRKRYYDLLHTVWTQGYTVRSGPNEGVTIYTLTDREAAAFLGVERTTVCGRRNELQGGSGGDAFESYPLARKAHQGERRQCNIRPDGSEVYAYRPRLDVYSVPEDERSDLLN